MSFHDAVTIGDVHIIHQFEYADTAARTGATGLVATDVGKVARQTDTNTFWVLKDESPVTWTQLDGGGGAASGALDVIQQTFDYNDSSPIDFGTLVNGDEIINAEVEITTVFDDPTAIVTLGQTTSAGNILASTQIDPTDVATYHNGENFPITGADGVRIQIVPGSSTQGQGRAVVTIRRV